MNRNTNQKKNNKTARGVGIFIAVLIGVILLLLTIRGCQIDPPQILPTDEVTQNPGIVYDDNAVEGGWNEADTDKIIESLNEKVKEGMINISMNTTPNFANSTSAGNLMLVNETVNRYPQIVEITRNDTGELIYKSGAIAVGSKIEYAKLDTELESGTYECTAMFYNVDPETGNYLGCAGAVIHINILE